MVGWLVVVCWQLVEARALKAMDVVGKNSPYAVVGWGNKTYKTKTLDNTNDPKW